MSTPPPSILRLSRLMAGFASVMLAAYPAAVAVSLGAAFAGHSLALWRLPVMPNGVTPIQTGIVLATLVSFVLLPVVIAFFSAMRRLFRRYARGEVLAPAACADLRDMGRWAFFMGILGLIQPTLQTLALSVGTESVVLSFAVTDGAIGFLVLGGTLAAIGWTMTEAVRIDEENAGFI
ncbi:MAG: hypothetical protein ACK4RZ_01300 [Paracoccaceae bacterium]